MLATAESLPGGWVAQAVIRSRAASEWYQQRLCHYSTNPSASFSGAGADPQEVRRVSEQSAREMATGARAQPRAGAVQSPASPVQRRFQEKPVVRCVCLASKTGKPEADRRFRGNRESVRRQS